VDEKSNATGTDVSEIEFRGCFQNINSSVLSEIGRPFPFVKEISAIKSARFG
jgi:hypothetical protein